MKFAKKLTSLFKKPEFEGLDHKIKMASAAKRLIEDEMVNYYFSNVQMRLLQKIADQSEPDNLQLLWLQIKVLQQLKDEMANYAGQIETLRRQRQKT